MPAIIGLNEEFQGQSFRLDSEVFRLGRAESNDLAMDDSLVSGSHCYFVFRDERWYVVDDHSTNGTSVNGTEVLESVLNDGDVVTVGETKFRFLQEATDERIPPMPFLDGSDDIDPAIEDEEVATDDGIETEPTSSRKKQHTAHRPEYGDYEDYETPPEPAVTFEEWLDLPSRNNTILAMSAVVVLFFVMLLFFTQVV